MTIRSLRYPLEALNGKLVLTDSYPVIVGQSILAALQTRLEERVYRPEFGLPDHTFDSIGNLALILAEVRGTIELAIAEDFPEVTFQVLGGVNDDGRLDLTVAYQSPEFSDRVEVTI